MTNETNAALSALREARKWFDAGTAPVELALSALRQIDEAIHLLEASQREAPVAEGSEPEFIQAGQIYHEDDGSHSVRWGGPGTAYPMGMPINVAPKHGDPFYIRNPLHIPRLAESPSVTRYDYKRVAREMVMTVYQWQAGNPSGLDLMDLFERMLAAQFPIPPVTNVSLEISEADILQCLVDFGDKWHEENDVADYTFTQFQSAQAKAVHTFLQLPAPGKAADEGVIDHARESSGWVSVKVPAQDGFYLVLLPEGRIRDFAYDIYGGWPDGATHYMKRPNSPEATK